MKNVAIVSHSGFGHTLFAAQKIQEGLESKHASVKQIDLGSTSVNLDELNDMDAIIFGSPTYMGGVSSTFKKFMEDTSQIWLQRKWRNKLAAGFTVSGSPSGDKLSTLNSMVIFALQHGMIWVGYDRLPETQTGSEPSKARNNLGSYLGLMLQSAPTEPVKAFTEGDLSSAVDFGERIGELLSQGHGLR